MSQIVKNENQLHHEEITPKYLNGMLVMLLNIAMMIASIVLFIWSVKLVGDEGNNALAIATLIASILYFCLIGPILFAGLKVLKPKEALVLTLFGRYVGTLKGPGFFFVNPFTVAVKPDIIGITTGSILTETPENTGKTPQRYSKKISLKTMTLNNERQKINDQLGNPIIIGIVVIWKVVNAAKAVFNVENYAEYLSIQADSALRNIVRLYPYDISGVDNEKTLRGSSVEIAEKIKDEIQQRVEIAGLEIIEARITQLSYAPEIAAAMLQRQQASAIIDARQMIVEGAVGMVEMALEKLSENDIVQLDEERKAAMVSNLLVVLCGNKDAQPVVNSGSLY